MKFVDHRQAESSGVRDSRERIQIYFLAYVQRSCERAEEPAFRPLKQSANASPPPNLSLSLSPVMETRRQPSSCLSREPKSQTHDLDSASASGSTSERAGGICPIERMFCFCVHCSKARDDGSPVRAKVAQKEDSRLLLFFDYDCIHLCLSLFLQKEGSAAVV